MKVGILGGSGYAGAELYRLLLNHPNFNVVFVSSEKYAGKPVEKMLKGFAHNDHLQNLRFNHLDDLPFDLDFVFSALPTGVLPKYVEKILEKTSLIFNVSGDFRFKDTATLQQYYPETLAIESDQILSSYYIPEFSDFNKNANIINLPGCMALASIYAAYPLVKNKLINQNIFVDVKTGSSGAGKSTKETAADRFGNFRLYRAFNHRHLPEIAMALGSSVGKVGFAAYSLDISRGIYASVYSQIKEGVTEVDVKKAYFKTYKSCKFVANLTGKRSVPMLKSTNGTNFAEVKATVHEGQCIAVASLDNLLKGAAGQAVQAANKYYQLAEDTGLDTLVGMWP